jgi:microcystin degradation protein MlrC
VEPADNVGGGGPGDCTDVLRALLRHDAEGAAVAIADPVSVAALRGVPVGGSARIAVGGRGWAADEGPVELEVTLISRSDGRFRLEDLNSHQVAAGGADIRMGESAVVRHRGITLLLNSRKTPPMDLGQWRSQGQPPEQFRIIAVKAAVAHRRAYEKIIASSHTVRSRGPCGSDLTAVPYRRLLRPIYPLDGFAR